MRDKIIFFLVRWVGVFAVHIGAIKFYGTETRTVEYYSVEKIARSHEVVRKSYKEEYFNDFVPLVNTVFKWIYLGLLVFEIIRFIRWGVRPIPQQEDELKIEYDALMEQIEAMKSADDEANGKMAR